ncbi:MAG: DoxX family membrane protein [Acidobacteria bacterium]|nr:DoxX family membrane protein [Acidobacteriota bacterium]
MRLRTISLSIQGIFYIGAGINHFWHAPFYIAIMPTYLPAPAFLVWLSGLCEIAGGVGLLSPSLRRIAAYGLAAMLVVYFSVHIHMIAHHAELFPHYPLWLLYARLLFQPVLIAWAASALPSGADAARTATAHPQ